MQWFFNLFIFLGWISHNVPVVYDVFAVAIKELRSNSSNRKNVAEQNTTKGVSPTGVLRSPSRRKAAKHIQSC
jgi:hypothetical protein